MLALPAGSLATEKARALLPDEYSRADAVANVQRTALLVAAFALGRGDLLRTAMQDRIHQPYRMEACPLLARLLPLAGKHGILGVALSGAGPGVRCWLPRRRAGVEEIIGSVRTASSNASLEVIEVWDRRERFGRHPAIGSSGLMISVSGQTTMSVCNQAGS